MEHTQHDQILLSTYAPHPAPFTSASYSTSYKPHPTSTTAPLSLEDLPQTRKRRWLHSLLGPFSLQGWRFGAFACFLSSTSVLTVNLVATIWASTAHRSNSTTVAEGVLAEGDCAHIRQLNTAVHFLINVLSSVLLSSSNYCMQCLSAPTRREVNRAHRRGRWLDIGVPSVRNLVEGIAWRRVLIWGVLGLTSLPLHLFFNSAVYAVAGANNYQIISVSQSFVSSPECTNCDKLSSHGFNATFVAAMHSKARSGELDRLDNAACIDAYAQLIQTSRRNLLLVLANSSINDGQDPGIASAGVFARDEYRFYAPFGGTSMPDNFDWMCSGISAGGRFCTEEIASVRADAERWAPGKRRVAYCLSEKAPGGCTLQFSPAIAVLVVVMNLLKAAMMAVVAFAVNRRESPLMTVGDAVREFLIRADRYTENMCLAEKSDIVGRKRAEEFPAGAREFRRKIYRWMDVTSSKRWWTFILIFTLTLITILILLIYSITTLPGSHSLRTLASYGLGAVDPRLFITGWGIRSLLGIVLIANTPQVILSLLYFVYNALITSMLLGREWAFFAHKRKGLRLSSTTPTGAQRSTYFLQLPYRFALPLMLLSALLHWLVSQSLFLVAVEAFTSYGTRAKLEGPNGTVLVGGRDLYMTCGFSPLAIIIAFVLGVGMLVASLAAGRIKYPKGMPLAGSCSAVIAAACHVPENEGRRIVTGRLTWGVVQMGPNGAGHCAFSVGAVGELIVGQKYAGREEGRARKRVGK